MQHGDTSTHAGLGTMIGRGAVVLLVLAASLALPTMPVLGAPPSTSTTDLGAVAWETAGTARSGDVSASSTEDSSDGAIGWTAGAPVDLDGAVLVGATLPRLDQEQAEAYALQLRTRSDGVWSAWTELPIADDGPDDDAAEAADQTIGTEPFWVADSDQVQVRVSGPDTPVLRMSGVVVSGGDGLGYSPEASVGASAVAATATPAMVSRSQWDPGNDCAPRQAPTYASDVRYAVVHHTAGSNSYSAADADDVVRAICLYHRNTRGWDDIGYNFLIDRYGKIYEGRAGGVTEAVQGAHVKGFNSGATGISMIGNFASADPPKAMRDAMDRLLAWKLDIHHIDPNGTSTEIAGSGSRWAAGTKVTIPTLFTHGQLNSTSCPGRVQTFVSGSQKAAPRVLARGSTRIYSDARPRFEQALLGARPTWSSTFSSNGPWRIQVTNSSGKVVRAGSGSGSSGKVTWDMRDGAGREVAPGAYTVTIERSDARPLTSQVRVLAPVETVDGGSAAGTSVALSKRTFDDPRYTAAKLGHSEDVVIAAAGKFSSTFAAPVAASRNAPLLLTGSSKLDASVRTEISRIRPDTAYLVGSTSELSSAIESELRSLGVKTIDRFGDAALHNTAGQAAWHVTQRESPDEAIVVLEPGTSSTAVADAVTAAGYAAGRELPLMVTGKDSVPSSTTWVLEQRSWTRVLVIGSGPVSSGVLNELRRASGDSPVHQVEGSDVYGTSGTVFDVLWRRRHASSPSFYSIYRGDEIVAIPGDDPLGSLAGVVAAEARGAYPLLVDPSDLDRSAGARDWLKTQAASFGHAMVAGSISSKTAGQLESVFRSAGPHRAAGETWGEVSFSDVSSSNPHADDIAQFAARGITQGCTADKFCPDLDVTRAQMATFLARALDLPAGDGSRFTDVGSGNTHAGAIGAIADAGITRGYADGSYRPDADISRAEMATLLTRAFDLPASSEHRFRDVDPNSTHGPSIDAIAAAGITLGFSDGTYKPNLAVTREQMASFIIRALD